MNRNNASKCMRILSGLRVNAIMLDSWEKE